MKAMCINEKKEFVWQDELATPFYYRRQVHTLYGMVTDHIGPVSFDAGLRSDNVHDVMNIQVADASRNRKYSDLFPSVHISYDAGKAGPFTLGYSYRTNRPGIWNLEPYITYEDYFTKKIADTCSLMIKVLVIFTSTEKMTLVNLNTSV